MDAKAQGGNSTGLNILGMGANPGMKAQGGVTGDGKLAIVTGKQIGRAHV